MSTKKHIALQVSALLIAGLFSIPAATSAATSCTAITANLKVGSRGAQVTALQAFLKGQGFFKASSVPTYGAATKAAVIAFQKAYRISATGTVGPLTRAKIKALCGGNSGSSAASGSASGGTTASGGTPSTTGFTPTDAPTQFEVTGWIPYWRAATGTADTMPNLTKLTEVNPFVYTLKSDGTILDNGPLNQDPWTTFDATAKADGVRVIPTIMSSDANLMYSLLSDATSRQTLENNIASAVSANNYDGIDIDFENKSPATKDYFSAFLLGLKQRLGQKWLMCTIETRIPNEDKYFGTEIPADAGIYANDLKAIGTYCDRVRLMTYDQQGIDLKLSAQAGNQLYAPNADPAWVTAVVNYMSQDIPKSKMLIGIPTYGYEYSVTTYEGGENTYDILWTFNPGYAAPQRGVSQPSLSEIYHVTPERTSWGELAFTYVPTDGTATTSPLTSSPFSSSLAAAAAASTYANQYHSHLTYRYVVWPDEVTVQQKIALAKSLGVRGVSIFKLDGGQDPDIWNVLSGVKQ